MKRFMVIVALLCTNLAAGSRATPLLHPENFSSFACNTCAELFDDYGYTMQDIPTGLVPHFEKYHALIIEKLNRYMTQTGTNAIPVATARELVRQVIEDWAQGTQLIIIGQVARDFALAAVELAKDRLAEGNSSELVATPHRNNPVITLLGNKLERLRKAYESKPAHKAVPYQY